MPSPRPTFEQVFEEHLSYVLHTLKRLGVREADLEDVAQEVFVAISAHLHEYDPQRAMKPWIFAFVFRLVGNYLRHSQRKQDPSDTEALSSSQESPEAHTLRNEARNHVHRALATLSLEDRAVLTLMELEGFGAKEVSDALVMPVADVYARLRTARERFKRAYRQICPPSSEISL